MRQLNVAAALVFALILARPICASEQFGAAMPEGEVTPLHSAIADLDGHDDERAKFSGRIVEICQNKGCWMLLESEGVSERVKMHDDEFSVRKDEHGTAVVWGKLFEHRLSDKQPPRRSSPREPRRREESSAASDFPSMSGGSLTNVVRRVVLAVYSRYQILAAGSASEQRASNDADALSRLRRWRGRESRRRSE